MASDAKIRNAVTEYDRRNLERAREVLADQENPQLAHLVDESRRILARLRPQEGTK